MFTITKTILQVRFGIKNMGFEPLIFRSGLLFTESYFRNAGVAIPFGYGV